MASSGLIIRFLSEIESHAHERLAHSARILSEIEAHLLDAVERHVASGLDRARAEELAVDLFGAPAELVAAFEEQQRGGTAMPTRFSWLAGLAGMVGVVLTAGALTVDALTRHGHLNSRFGWPAFAAVGVVLSGVSLGGVVRRGWGRLGSAGRYAGIAIVCSIPCFIFGGWSWIGGLAWGLVASAMIVCAARLVRLSVFSRAPLLLLGAGMAAAAIYALVNVQGELPQYIPGALGAVGWFWLSYTLWSERPRSSAGVGASAAGA